MKIVVFDYGAGNVHSACHALSGLGADVQLTDDPQAAMAAQGLLVPGVGAFGYVMDSFRARSGPQIIEERLKRGAPVLGICVGMQILFESSSEKGHHKGLGFFSGEVQQLPAPRLPHMGWSTVTPAAGMRMFAGLEPDRFYFVHSYARLAQPPIIRLRGADTEVARSESATPTGAANEASAGAVTPVRVATADYSTQFAAAIEDGPLWATQFHPEKSGKCGLALLANWLRTVDSAS